MTRRPLRLAASAAAVACAIVARATAQSTTQPATQPDGFDVQDWVILDVDATNNRANARPAWPATLPPFVSSRRGSPDANDAVPVRPEPVGVIRLTGTLDPKSPVDVLLNVPGGEVEASWPRAQTKTGRLLWPNLVPAGADDRPTAADAAGWLAPLRGGGTLIKSDQQAEAFLLYDVAFNYGTPLKLRAPAAGELRASNSSAAPLHDLTLYNKQSAGWTRVALDTLPGTPPTSRPASQPATKPDPSAAFDATQPATQAIAVTRPATTRTAATGPATAPAGVALTMSPAAGTAADMLKVDWRPRLLAAGVPSSDVDTLLAILDDRALDEHWLTAVYRLDPAEMDKLLPLDVVPAPRHVTRVGLVIVHGLDPAVTEEIDKLIARCGDPSYAVRQDASAQLKSLGQAAKAKLNAALNNPDAEISLRAELALEAIDKKSGK